MIGRKPDNSLDLELIYVCGGSGTGKSAWVKRRIARDERIAVWDFKHEYAELPGFRATSSMTELVAMMKASKRARLAFVPPEPDPRLFDLYCGAVSAWGNCRAVMEEVASISDPGKMRGYAGNLLRMGRGWGVRMIYVVQRPAEASTTITGLATHYHIHRLSRADDRRYMAREADVPLAEIEALRNLEWIEADATTGAKTRGKVEF